MQSVLMPNLSLAVSARLLPNVNVIKIDLKENVSTKEAAL